MSTTTAPDLGIYSSTELARAGIGRREREAAVASGELIKLRRPWYARRDAHPDAMAAVSMGGALTATSASRHHGLWTIDDESLHVLLPRHGSRKEAGTAFRRPVCVHWAAADAPLFRVVASPLQTVRDAAHCRPLEVAVAMADSAIATGQFRLDELHDVTRKVASLCDPGSQSGTETLCRLRLRRLGVRVRTQVLIPGVGRVDLLIGDRLVIECDSETYHDGYRSTRDYDRDAALIAQGYIILRLQYRHVMFEWPRVEALVLAIVRSDRHLWRRSAGSAGTVLGL